MMLDALVVLFVQQNTKSCGRLCLAVGGLVEYKKGGVLEAIRV